VVDSGLCPVCSKAVVTSFMEEYCSKKCYFQTMKVPVKAVWERDDKTCHICGEDVYLEDASRDHLVPKSHGGSMTFENVALAHRECNSRRGTKPVAEVKRDRRSSRRTSSSEKATEDAGQELYGAAHQRGYTDGSDS